MYEYLKDLLPVAELVGEPMSIMSFSDDKIMGNRVEITGCTPDGRNFRLELRIDEEAMADD